MYNGLTNKEVLERIKRNEVNNTNLRYSRSIKSIVKNNVLTIFNMINISLAILVIITGYYTNLLFIFVTIFNTAIAIYQEIKSKLIIDKLKISIQEKVSVKRDNELIKINENEIVLDDLIILKQGNQVLVDVEVINSNLCEVDESIITGESNNIIKKIGDTIYSGSIIISGNCEAKVISIGSNNYSNKLIKEANQIKEDETYLRSSLNKILKLITLIIIPTMILLFISQYFFSDITWQKAILSTVAGVIGMIPSGLILLTSITSSVGVIKMAKKNTIVQRINGIETLASINVLCLDKTGTITDGTFKVIDTIYLNNKFNIGNIIKNMINNEVINETDIALNKYYKKESNFEILKKVPFSSYRKYSLVEFKKEGTYALGALEYMVNDYSKYNKYIKEYIENGYRVITLTHSLNKSVNQIIPKNSKPIAFIILKDNIRKNVNETLNYFKHENVSLKIISGDKALTVSNVMKQIDFPGYDLYIDGIDLPEDYYELKEIVNKYFIFGRVTPYQKMQIIKILKEDNKVGMIGDGVNDILALKIADCSIALNSSVSAPRSVSQIVLINSDFNILPSIMNEGRRVINNMERVSSLYLIKTIYSFLLSVLSIILIFKYPFYPIQLTLIGSLCVGLPSFILALEPNTKIVSGNFVKKILINSIPSGICVTLNVILLLIICSILKKDITNYNVVIVTITGLVNILNIYKLSITSKKMIKLLLFICGVSFIIFITLFNNIFLVAKFNIYTLLMVLVFFVMDIFLIKYIKEVVKKINVLK